MTPPTTPPTGPHGEPDWLSERPRPGDRTTGDSRHDDTLTEGPGETPQRLGRVATVALVAAGIVTGVAVVSIVQHRNDASAASARQTAAASDRGTSDRRTFEGPGGSDGSGRSRGFGGGDRAGGVDGEDLTVGTVSAVGSSSVTLTTSSGNATYAVDDSTDIVRNGAFAELSDLNVGETALVHLRSTSSAGHRLADRIIVGLPGLGDGGRGGGGGFGPPPGLDGGDGGSGGTVPSQPQPSAPSTQDSQTELTTQI